MHREREKPDRSKGVSKAEAAKICKGKLKKRAHQACVARRQSRTTGLTLDRRRNVWMGQSSMGITLGCSFEDYDEALEALKKNKVYKMRLKTHKSPVLSHSDEDEGRRGWKRPEVQPMQLKTRMACLIKWGEPATGQTHFTPDFYDSEVHAQRSKQMYLAWPCLQLLSWLFKAKGWKDGMLKTWVAAGRPTCTWNRDGDAKLKSAAEDLWELLMDLGQEMKKPQSTVPSSHFQHANRFREREMGPRSVYVRLNLAKKYGGKGLAPTGKAAMWFKREHKGNNKCLYKLMTHPTEKEKSVKILSQLILGWLTIIDEVPYKSPETCSECSYII